MSFIEIFFNFFELFIFFFYYDFYRYLLYFYILNAGPKMMRIMNCQIEMLIKSLLLHKLILRHLESQNMKVTIEQEIGLQELK